MNWLSTRPYGEQEKQILTAEAVEFLTELVTHFTPQRNKLLAARIQQQQDIDNGTLPDFISKQLPFAMLIGKLRDSCGLRRPPRRDNWPGRAQDGRSTRSTPM